MKSLFPAPRAVFTVFSDRERLKRNLYSVICEDNMNRGYLVYDHEIDNDRLHCALLAWQYDDHNWMRIEIPQLECANLSNIRRIVNQLRKLGVYDDLFRKVVKPIYGTWTNFVYQVKGVQFEFSYMLGYGWMLQTPILTCEPYNLMR